MPKADGLGRNYGRLRTKLRRMSHVQCPIAISVQGPLLVSPSLAFPSLQLVSGPVSFNPDLNLESICVGFHVLVRKGKRKRPRNNQLTTILLLLHRQHSLAFTDLVIGSIQHVRFPPHHKAEKRILARQIHIRFHLRFPFVYLAFPALFLPPHECPCEIFLLHSILFNDPL